ncbi:YceI family protein [Maricaulis sp.]|uniref:YceI family protein n=1 Tax=Maricaulis sp. TaxID=1486257 RepID=UPI0025C1A73D|nr:YceI family protein [Maricaulis sp.]
MRVKPAFLVVSACLALGACLTPTTDPQRLPAGEWALDPAHASLTWQVRHMGLSWYTGRFDTLDARLDFDPARPEAAQLTAILDPASISTGDPAFDAALAADWFHAGRHPQIVFNSSAIEITGETTGRVTGDLTLNGVTAPVTLDVTFNGGLTSLIEGRPAIGFSAAGSLDRDTFNVGNLPHSIVGPTVRILIEAEFLREGD